MKKENENLNNEVMTSNDVCSMLGISRSYLYFLTSTHKIPYYKPLGKKSISKGQT